MDKEKTLTMYVTKYWATQGIFKVRGRVTGEGDRYFTSGPVFVRIGKDAFETEDEAQIQVRRAAEKKHTSLMKEAAKIARIELYGVAVVDRLK
jgi:hypothetical protein